MTSDEMQRASIVLCKIRSSRREEAERGVPRWLKEPFAAATIVETGI